MATYLTIVGHTGGDPELRFTPNGDAVCNFSVAVGQRKKQGDDWVDDGTAWYRVTCWRQLAHNVADTVTKGMRVHVSGVTKHTEWETKDGEKRISFEINADEVSPSLRWATAQVTRNEKRGGPPIADEPPPSYDPSEEPF